MDTQQTQKIEPLKVAQDNKLPGWYSPYLSTDWKLEPPCTKHNEQESMDKQERMLFHNIRSPAQMELRHGKTA